MTKQQIEGAEFVLSSQEPDVYDSNGHRCYLDLTGKGMLRAAGPEENVRQQFVSFLIDQVGVPPELLATEDAVSHHGAASQGRMDIFCRLPNRDPLFVVECKQQGLVLEVEQHLRQVRRYAKLVGCRLAVLTNGDETCAYVCEGSNYKLRKLQLPVNAVPTYQEMLNIGNYEIQTVSPQVWYRPTWDEMPASAEDLRDEPFASMVSTGSGRRQIRWLASLGSLFLDAHRVEEWQASGFDVADMGIEKVSPTNRSGGRWDGEYRGFLVTNDHADSHLVRFLMTSDWKGHTTLVVAVDDENGKSCNELQLDMDFRDTVEQSAESAVIWHNGKLPGGKRGWTKAAMIDYAKGHVAHLVEGEYVRLGEIPVNRHVEWQDAHELITNCVEYAVLRKRFKEER